MGLKTETVGLLVSLPMLAVGGAFLRIGTRRLLIVWGLQGSPTSVDEISDNAGRIDVVGSVQPLSEPVEAPFSGRPTVACEYAVRQERGDEQMTIFEELVGDRFALVGDRNRIVVDPQAFSLVTPEAVPLRTRADSVFSTDVHGRLAAVGSNVDENPALDLTNARRSRYYVERCIQPGDTVRVIGELTAESGTRVATSKSDERTGQLVVESKPEISEALKEGLAGVGIGGLFAGVAVFMQLVAIYRILGL